jgi:VIT1/CCC1 family predicted Fe2+/Mn2+ transporter
MTHQFDRPRGVVAQVRAALAPKARLATFVGFLLGGFVPVATYVVAHCELTSAPLYTQTSAALVLGGLTFSAKTVFHWAAMAFENVLKALGFVVISEGVMTFSTIHWLSLVALGYLVMINGTATACVLSVGRVRR